MSRSAGRDNGDYGQRFPVRLRNRTPEMSELYSLEPYSLNHSSGLPQMAAAPTTPRQKLRYTRILKTAAGFAQRHLDALSLADVAAKADIPLGTLYRYFPSTTHLMLALHRAQLEELEVEAWPSSARTGAHALAGVVMEIFHLRVMQPAVEQALVRTPYGRDPDSTQLMKEIDEAAQKALDQIAHDPVKSRLLLHMVTGLVQSVRNRRLSLFEAEEDLKKACGLVARA